MFIRILALFLIFTSSSLFSSEIIYLNGPSSVGKTTLAKAIQDEMMTPYFRVGFDQIVQMMPAKLNWEGGVADLGFSLKKSVDEQGKPLQILQVGPIGAQMPHLLREIVVTLAKNNYNVIIDDVSIEKESFELWKAALKDYNVLWVGLTAPLDVLEKREKERGDREIGQARSSHTTVHEGFTYDLFLDTSETSLDEMVQLIKSKSER